MVILVPGYTVSTGISMPDKGPMNFMERCFDVPSIFKKTFYSLVPVFERQTFCPLLYGL